MAGAHSHSKSAGDEISADDSPILPFNTECEDEEGHGEEGGEGEISGCGKDKPPSPSFASSFSSNTPPPKIKVTMSFMKAYKAMRGPRDVEPSPLFGCLSRARGQAGRGDEGDDDPFTLAGRDEVKLLNDVNDAIIDVDGLGEDDGQDGVRPPPSDNDDVDNRQTVFYFEQPNTTRLLSVNKSLSDNCSTCSGSSVCSVISDYSLDHGNMDQGWIKANGPVESEDDESYVSDDDGDPSEARISPAIFRALAAGCKRNDVDSLRVPVPETSSSLRPLTPQDKILDASIDTTHRNNVEPYCHRRQFDIYTGEELSPAYRVQPGPASSTLWSPPGVTPERAGLFLLLLQQGQGEQHQPARGSGMPALFQRMAPLECHELRTRLYGGIRTEEDGVSSTSSPSSSSSSSYPSSSPSGSPSPSGSSGDEKQKRKTMTFTWSEVNEAVQNCRFDPATGSVTTADNKPLMTATGSGTVTSAEQAILETFRGSWRTIQAGQAEDARLVAANERAQAAITAQTRCLAQIEHQVAACREAERARECKEAQAHYRQQHQAERRAESRSRKRHRRQRRILRAIDEQLRNLHIRVRETEARLVQGRELQSVLARRLQDGKTRLARLCRQHGAADAAALSKTLAAELAQLEMTGRG